MNMNFELKLDNINYVCIGSHFSKEDQNWTIRAELSGLKVTVDIPIDSKLTRLQVIAFIERLHKGLQEAKKDQKTTVEYTS